MIAAERVSGFEHLQRRATTHFDIILFVLRYFACHAVMTASLLWARPFIDDIAPSSQRNLNLRPKLQPSDVKLFCLQLKSARKIVFSKVLHAVPPTQFAAYRVDTLEILTTHTGSCAIVV